MSDDPLDDVAHDEPSSFVSDLLDLHLESDSARSVKAAIAYMQSQRGGEDGPSLVQVCREWLLMQQITDVWLPRPDATGDYVYEDGSLIILTFLGRYRIRCADGVLLKDSGRLADFDTAIAAALRMMELGIGPAVCKRPVNRPAPETVVESVI